MICCLDLSQTEEDETGESEAKRIKKSKKGKRSQTRVNI